MYKSGANDAGNFIGGMNDPNKSDLDRGMEGAKLAYKHK